MRMLDATAFAAIGVYQRYLSPYKGFCCAYRAQTGRRSCSAYAKAIVERLGVIALARAMPRQFNRCKAAYAALAMTSPDEPSKNKEEAHSGWKSCDGNSCGMACDVVSLPCNLLN